MKKIPLSKGNFALVDDEDYERLMQWKWCVGCSGYAVRNSKLSDGGKRRTIFMHHQIVGEVGKETDHKDVNKLNNTRSNLRLCDRSMNAANKKKFRINTSSKYKGVSWFERTKKWVVFICVRRKHFNLGYFSSEQEAAIAYNNAAIKYFGEFANLNVVA